MGDLVVDNRGGSDPGAFVVDTTPAQRIEILLGAYGEVCNSYHAIDDFRTKLLGILPIASLAGILLLGKDNLFQGDVSSQRLIVFASFFAAGHHGLIRTDCIPAYAYAEMHPLNGSLVSAIGAGDFHNLVVDAEQQKR